MSSRLPALLPPTQRDTHSQISDRLQGAGVPTELATRVAGLEALYSALDIVELSEQTGEPVEGVASVYFALGSRLQLYWVRDQIEALPRDSRWRTLARAALRDDLYAQARALAADVLRTSAPGDAPDARVESWVGRNPEALLRSAQLIIDVRAGGAADLATLSVVVRENHNLIQAAVAPPVTS